VAEFVDDAHDFFCDLPYGTDDRHVLNETIGLVQDAFQQTVPVARQLFLKTPDALVEKAGGLVLEPADALEGFVAGGQETLEQTLAVISQLLNHCFGAILKVRVQVFCSFVEPEGEGPLLLR
jgi:hypothetical protein